MAVLLATGATGGSIAMTAALQSSGSRPSRRMNLMLAALQTSRPSRRMNLLLLKVLLLKVPLTAAMTPRTAGVIGELHQQILLQALNPSRRSVRCWCQGSARIATAVRGTGTSWQPLSSRRGPEKACLEAGLSGLCWGSRRCERARW